MNGIFIYAMIRYAKHKDIDYIIVDTTLEVDGVVVPVQIQVNVQNVKEESRSKVFRVASVAFNRHLNFDKTKSQPKRSWWQQILGNT